MVKLFLDIMFLGLYLDTNPFLSFFEFYDFWHQVKITLHVFFFFKILIEVNDV